jgi:imidazolonepropionase-like amidohydrolase
MKKTIFRALLGFLSFTNSFSQSENPVNGVKDKRPEVYAFTNATIFQSHDKKIEKATLLIKDGKVIQVGTSVTIPKGAIVQNLEGKFIYPSFVEIYSDYGLEEIKKSGRNWDSAPQFESNKKGVYHWNQAVKPEINASESFKTNAEKAKELRNLGFGTVVSHYKDGIARGTSVTALIGDERENKLVLKDKTSMHYSFSKGTSTQDYPSSLMGSIALLRQTFYDADWYKKAKQKDFNYSYEAIINNNSLPQIFESPDVLTHLRADKVGDEFGMQFIIKGSGDEYQKANALKNSKATFIIPLNFPNTYDIEDPYDAEMITVEDMKHWEMAPYNPKFLTESGIEFAFTSSDLKDKKDFLANVRKAIESGLSESDALKALTTTPAKLMKINDKVGSITNGMVANFIITSKPVFDKESVIYQNWVNGKKYEVKDITIAEIAGKYDFKLDNKNYKVEISGKAESPEGKLFITDSNSVKINISRSKELISIYFNTKDSLNKGDIRLSGVIDGKKIAGKGQNQKGDWLNWSATWLEPLKEDKKKDSTDNKAKEIGKITFPFVAFGNTEVPKTENVLFKNATVWTNEKDGILKETDVLVKNGVIAQIGTNISEPTAKIVDAKGKHLTSGIVDEHSHIAISKGVNEGTKSVTAEVSIADVVNSEDVNIYRQLAGGVVAAQLLHGSANCIGGQSAIIKLKWGVTPEEMKIKGADGFIKCALGENVKQSNWGDRNTVRFPQTRMGVEQVFYDAFKRAREYEASWKAYNSAKDKTKLTAPAKDLELETLVEILNSKRFISCHSYVQSEINMLMKVADSMGFKINTFTHILEGYKVADKMAQHGAAGSTFSDWWAYKNEVKDAIPFNGAIMHEQKVLTAFNSDDAEMARRLNQEAAKAVKYGNVSEEDAWKFVTLNPAKMLHLDKKTGSIKVGKDADLVLWNDNPLSIYATALQTYIEGVKYFDYELDTQKQKELTAERQRLIQKMMDSKNKGDKTQPYKMKEKKRYHCDSVEEEIF